MRAVPVLTLVLGLLAVSGAGEHGGRAVHAQARSAMLTPEDSAKRLVQDYYTRLRDGLRWGGGRETRCRSDSVHECFNGEWDCGVGPHGWGCAFSDPSSARGVLLDMLDGLAQEDPDSEWLAGQRVALALKHNDPQRALRAADLCASTRWWCQALRGLALHAVDVIAGEATMDSAFSAAPADEPAWARPRVERAGDRGLQCEVQDVEPLLEPGLQRYYGGCADTAFVRRFWLLADPLWSQPGNERRAQHLAQQVLARLADELWRLQPGGGSYSRFRHQRLVPAGFPNSFVILRVFERQYYVFGGYSAVPDSARFLVPAGSAPADWHLGPEKDHAITLNYVGNVNADNEIPRATPIPPERFITQDEWHGLDHQLVTLWRGDSVLVVAAAVSERTEPAASTPAWLAVADVARLTIDRTPATPHDGGTFRGQLAVTDGELAASLEIIGTGWRERARLGAAPPALTQRFGISQPALLDPAAVDAGLPVVDALLPSTTLRAGKVALYTEIYGAGAGEELDFDLVITPRTRQSLPGRILTLFTRSGRGASRIIWTEPAAAAADAPLSKSFEVDLNGFPPGIYELNLTVRRSADGQEATATRTATVR